MRKIFLCALSIVFVINYVSAQQTWDQIAGINPDRTFIDFEFNAPGFGVGVDNFGDVYGYDLLSNRWVQTSPGGSVNGVKFSPTGTLYASSNSGTLYKSTIIASGSIGWQALTIAISSDLNNSYFEDDDNGWVVGDNASLYSTNNGGISFQRQTVFGLDGNYTDIHMDGDIGILTSTGGLALTTNGGSTWQPVSGSLSSSYSKVEFTNGTFVVQATFGGFFTINQFGSLNPISPSNTVNAFSLREGQAYFVGPQGESWVNDLGGGGMMIGGVPRSVNLFGIGCFDNGCYAGGGQGNAYWLCQGITVGGKLWGNDNSSCSLTDDKNGYANVELGIFTAGGFEIDRTVTASDGTYEFTVPEGEYFIRILSSFDDKSSAIYGMIPCGNVFDPNTNEIRDQNLTIINGQARTPLVDLRCGEELGPFGVTNLTVDLGLGFSCGANDVHPLAQPECELTSPICDYSNFTGGCHLLYDPISVPGASGCNNQFNSGNPNFISFIAGTGNYTLRIINEGCLPNQDGSIGLIYKLYNRCNVNTPIACSEECGSAADLSISSSTLTPGNTYYLEISGCDGSLCSYQLAVDGDYTPFRVPEVDEITCNTMDCNKVCTGGTLTFNAIDAQGILDRLTADFQWDISLNGTNVYTETTTSNEITYDFGVDGDYLICLDRIDSPCEADAVSICLSVQAETLADEDFGLIKLCGDEINFYSGPLSVNDEGGITDPNGDGVLGWVRQGGILFDEGLNEQTVTNTLGCMYDQFFEIQLSPLPPIEDIKAVVCDESEFPIIIMQRIFGGPVDDLSVTIPDGSVGGCDSTSKVTIYHIEYDGQIASGGCDSAGVILSFNPTITINSGNFTPQVEWIDDLGNVVPDDGDGDPFTTRVPFSRRTYTMNIEVDADGLRTCTYSFDYDVEFVRPSITGPDTVCVSTTEEYIFILPNNSTPLWNLDNANNNGTFALGQPLPLSWDTVGTKSLTLAYLENGCYVERKKEVEVVDRYMSKDFTCVAAENSIVYTWPVYTGSTISSIDITTGQNGAVVGNTLTINNLSPGEVATVVFTTSSPFCGERNFTSSCQIESCDGLGDIDDFDQCGENPICDISTLTEGCSTLNSVRTDSPNIPCFSGSSFNTRWIPFTAGLGDYDLIFYFDNCDPSNSNPGFQYAIYESCNLNSPLICSASCRSDSLMIDTEDLIPGKNYEIVINGCNGSICDLSLEIVGNYSKATLPEASSITTSFDPNDIICTGQLLSATINLNASTPELSNSNYQWSLLETNNLSQLFLDADNPTVSIPSNLPAGDYQLCFEDIQHPCDMKVYDQICTNFTLLSSGEPLIIQCAATIDAISFSWNEDTTHDCYVVELSNGIIDTIKDNSYVVTGLNPGDIVDIKVTVTFKNGCPSQMAMLSCQAQDCPPYNFILSSPVGVDVCRSSTLTTIGLVLTSSGGSPSGGVGTYSGLGVNPTSGVIDLATVTNGLNTYTYTYVENGCVYNATITLNILTGSEPTFSLSSDTICINEELTVTFDGIINSSSSFAWDFDNPAMSTGSGLGPFNIAFNTSGPKTITLNVNDSICGDLDNSRIVIVSSCGLDSCICPAIIDTTVLCTSEFDPVCGCDGVTYSNACIAQNYAGVRTWTQGPCDMTDTLVVNAMCDDDNAMTVDDVIDVDCICRGRIVDQVNDLNAAIKYYPNPTVGVLQFEDIPDTKVKIVNMLGQQLKEDRITNGTLHITDLPNGIYLINIENIGLIRVIKN